jgi:hypothetical protein
VPQSQFDPCRQWLGIDAVDLANPWLVLGLRPGEKDPLAVLRAAEARILLLRGIAPGPFDMARNALIKRVEEAREAVLSQIAATPQPGAVIGTSFQPPPPPGGVASPAMLPVARPAMSFDPATPSAVSDSSTPTIPSGMPWVSPDVANGGTDFVAVRTSPVYRKQSSWSGTIFLLLAGLAAAAGGLVWNKMQKDRAADDRQRRVAVADAKRHEEAKEAKEEEVTEEEIEPVVPVRKRRAPPPPALEDSPAEDVLREPEDPTSDDAVSTSPAPRPRAPARPSAPAAAPAPQPPAEPADGKVEESDDDKRQIEAAIQDAFAALQNEEYDAARKALDAAAEKSGSNDSKKRVNRWRDLVTYAEGFAGYRTEAVAAVKSGQEYEIDGRKIGIIEVDKRKLIYRDRGKNVTKSRGKIPTKILMAIITDWFDANPANNLYLGAHYATKREPDAEKAREYWKRAQAGGADASTLLPLLDDPVLQAAGTADPNS